MGHLLFGVISILCGLSGVFIWWADFGSIVRGFVPLALLVIGFVAIGAATSSKRKRPAPSEIGPTRIRLDGVLRAPTARERHSVP